MGAEAAAFGTVLVLGLLSLLYLGKPIFSGRRYGAAVNTELDELMLERERSYTALADLDFDRECGKISDADYETLRADLMRETAAVLEQLDARIAESKGEESGGAGPMDDDMLEREIEAFKNARDPYR